MILSVHLNKRVAGYCLFIGTKGWQDTVCSLEQKGGRILSVHWNKRVAGYCLFIGTKGWQYTVCSLEQKGKRGRILSFHRK